MRLVSIEKREGFCHKQNSSDKEGVENIKRKNWKITEEKEREGKKSVFGNEQVLDLNNCKPLDLLKPHVNI